MLFWISSTTAVLVLALSTVNNSYADEVVGKWFNYANNETMLFAENGAFFVGNGGQNASGSYSLHGKKLYMETDTMSGKRRIMCDIEIKKETFNFVKNLPACPIEGIYIRWSDPLNVPYGNTIFTQSEHWIGMGESSDGKAFFSLEVRPNGSKIHVDHTTYECGGTWDVMEYDRSSLKIRQSIEYGKDACVTGVEYSLTQNGSEIIFNYSHPAFENLEGGGNFHIVNKVK